MDKDLQEKLSWLEDELLGEEYEDYENYDDLDHLDLDDILDEFSQPEELPKRSRQNRAVYFERAQFADEDFDENAALLVEKKKTKKKDKKDPDQRSRRKVRFLAWIACLEVLGILGILCWWMRWLI